MELAKEIEFIICTLTISVKFYKITIQSIKPIP